MYVYVFIYKKCLNKKLKIIILASSVLLDKI